PTNVVATPGNASASVAFSVPTDDGGSSITGFKVRVLGRRGGVIATTTGSSSPITVTGLMNGHSYGFTVAATNEQGTGAASTESVAVTPSGPPGAPVGFGHSGAQTVVASGLADPSGVALDRDGKTYLALAGGVDTISADNARTLLGTASTWAGTLPRGVATDAAGNVYVALLSLTDGSGRVVVVAPDGSSRTAASGLCDVQGVAVDEEGSLYVTCPGGHSVLEISKDGVTSPIGSNWGAPSGIAVDANGNVFVADRSRAQVVKIAPNGSETTLGQASLVSPQGIAVDDAGHVYVAQATEHVITKIDPDGALSTLGSGLRNPRSIALGEDGTLTVVDADTGRLLRIENPPLVEVGDGQATISFTSPGSDGGASISGYVVTVFDSSGGVLTTKRGASSPITVTGLTNGQSYAFAVQAANRHGDGAISTRTALVELKIPEPAPTAPEAPMVVSVDPGNGSGLVVFTAPRDNGSPITKYTVTATDSSNAVNGGQKCSTPDGSTLECLVTGLVNGDDYAFTVVATNVAGDSPPSASSSTVTPATNPGAPTITSATRGNGSATIAWTNGAANGSTVQSSSIYAFSGPTLVASKTDCSGSPCTIFGLTNGTTYTFKVSGTNGVGEGDVSVASSEVTPATNPGAPTITSATRGNASASIAWTDGPANGSDIQSSSIYAYDGASVVATQTGCGNSPCTMTGLTVGTTYTFKVSHTNGVGEGSRSVASGEVTPATTPGAPVDVQSTAGNAQVTLGWSVPLTNGGSGITGYTARIGSNTCSTGAAGRQCTITGLVNGVAGSAVVTATNALGAGAEASRSVTALASAPSFTSANSGSGVPGKSIKIAVTTATLVAPTSKTGTWLSAEDLPAGVTFTAGKGTKANTGTISGLAPSSATSSFTLVASNAAGVGTRQVFTLRSVAFSSSSPASVTMQAGLAGSVLIESTDASAVITTSSALPDGLQFSADKGIATISGTPTTGKAKATTVKLTATDGAATATWVIAILVNSAPGIVVTGTTTQVHNKGNFSLKIAGMGFPAPSISVSHLPSGLSFSGGKVTGKIATAGTYSFDVEASNTVSSTALRVSVTAS
ncbi:MAG: fibronectin type III domain-containing protein, partial [Actinomycetes bacterium]